MKTAAVFVLALFVAACGAVVQNASGPYDPNGWRQRHVVRGGYIKAPRARRTYTYSRQRPQPHRQPQRDGGKVWDSPCDPEIMPKPKGC